MKILYIQPILASYRIPVVEALVSSSSNKLWVLADNVSIDSGFSTFNPVGVSQVHTKVYGFIGKRLFYQSGIIASILKIRPDIVISFANPRYISFWISLVLCRLVNIRFYAHGQGIFSHPKPNRLRMLIYQAMVALSKKYVCYTELSRTSLLAIGCNPSSLVVADNSVALSVTVTPDVKTYKENGILFIGRLREDCRLELLVKAAKDLKNIYPELFLHVIGAGVLLEHYKIEFAEFNWIVWHGAIHDDSKIAEISLNCRIGCYPGDAGLSVVHLFGLSLPQLIHSSMTEHMGPEPSYVIDGKNGFFFKKDVNGVELATRLKHIWSLNTSTLQSVGKCAYQSYISLNNPPLGERFLQIVVRNEAE